MHLTGIMKRLFCKIHHRVYLLMLFSLIVIYPVIFVAHNAAAALPPSVQWERNYGGSSQISRDITAAGDGGYVLVGHTTGNSYDAYLLKIDVNGNKLWEKTYGGNKNDVLTSVIRTLDNGFIMVGNTYSYGTGFDEDCYVIKTDQNGNVQWEKTFAHTSNDSLSSIQQTNDGGFLGVGYTVDGMLLIKINAEGQLQWEKTLTYNNSTDFRARDIEKTNDGKYIVLAQYDLSANEVYPYLVKVDEAGNIVWERFYNYQSSNGIGKNILVTTDGGFVFTSTVRISDYSYGGNYQGPAAFIIRTDSSGNVIWTQADAYGSSQNSLCLTSDDGIVIVGEKFFNYDDYYIHKFDSAGNTKWTTLYGQSGSDYPRAVVESGDRGLVVSGYSNSFGGTDVYIVKLSSDLEDTNTPSTTLSSNPMSPDGEEGWFKSIPTITLTSDKPGTTYYSWNSSNGPWIVYTGSFQASDSTKTLYYYSVNTEGVSETVKSQIIKVDIASPTVPTLSAAALNGTQIRLSWPASTDGTSGVSKYQVFNAETDSLIASVQTTSYVHSGLSAGQTYSHYIIVIDKAGNVSGRSNTMSVTTPTEGVSGSPAVGGVARRAEIFAK